MTATIERAETAERAPSAGGGRRAAGVLLTAGSIALAVWSAGLSARAGASTRWTVLAAVVIAWALAGAALLARRPNEPLGLLLAVATLASSGGMFGAAVIRFASDGGIVGSTALEAARVLRAAGLGVVPAAALHVLLVLPSGRIASRGRGVPAAAGYMAGIAMAVLARNGDLSVWIFPAAIVAAGFAGGIGVALRYPRLSPFDKRRVKWIGWSGTVTLGFATALLILRALVEWPPHHADVVLGTTALIPLALAITSSGAFLPGIDRLLAQTIALGGLGGVVGAVYFAIVIGIGRIPKENERTLLVLSMVAAGVAALLYIPARARLARLANRLVYGEQHAPDDVIRSFGTRLSRAVPLDELLLQMAESLRKSLVLEAVEVWTGSSGAFERSISDPDRGHARLSLTANEEPVVARAGVSGPGWMKIWLPQLLQGREDRHVRIVPITHSGVLLGFILVQRHGAAPPFSAEEERTLTELARQVGLALHNVRLDSALQASLDEVRRQAEALQASRGRIVAAADAERRKIERNLHDGAQQHLVALAVKVRLARQLAQANPEQARTMLEELSGDVTNALDELRSLAHGIYPPLLADRGLAEALRAAAGRASLPARIEADGVERYPQEIEAAIYFCCLEALQNAGKYAGENARAVVRLREEAGGLLFEIVDDGAGFDVRAKGVGAGFTNMSDRVGAIGGTLRVESAPGRGTKISGVVPLPPA